MLQERTARTRAIFGSVQGRRKLLRSTGRIALYARPPAGIVEKSWTLTATVPMYVHSHVLFQSAQKATYSWLPALQRLPSIRSAS